MRVRGSSLICACVLALGAEACAVVPQNRREHLADPTMQAEVDPVHEKTQRKKHVAREGAAGGDGQPAGGGCACGN